MTETRPLPLTTEEIARVTAPLERSWTLPPSAYTDAAVFRAEQTAIFGRDWLCVARSEQLPEPGDFLCVDLPGQPIVVVRGRDGQLRALSRVCLHRAMPIAEGRGNGNRFVCPYHNWTYELDGQLRSAPMMDGAEDFDTGACRLPELALEEWLGFVMVNQDPDAAPLSPQLEGLSNVFENYHFSDLVVAATLEFDSPWNWKILVENFMEAYHHIGTHRESFELAYPGRDSFVIDNDDQPWALLRMPGNEFAEPGGDGLPALPHLDAEQRRELLAAVVFPTLLLAGSGSLGVWYQLEPVAHDRMHLKIHALLPEDVADALDDESREALKESLRHIHTEDIAVNEGPWKGLHGGLTTQGRLSPYEKAIWQLNQFWIRRLNLPV